MCLYQIYDSKIYLKMGNKNSWDITQELLSEQATL